MNLTAAGMNLEFLHGRISTAGRFLHSTLQNNKHLTFNTYAYKSIIIYAQTIVSWLHQLSPTTLIVDGIIYHLISRTNYHGFGKERVIGKGVQGFKTLNGRYYLKSEKDTRPAATYLDKNNKQEGDSTTINEEVKHIERGRIVKLKFGVANFKNYNEIGDEREKEDYRLKSYVAVGDLSDGEEASGLNSVMKR